MAPNAPQNHDRSTIRPIKESMEDQLLARPGVTGVDIGEKFTGGKPTGELGIIVYVCQKVDEEKLSADEVVPKTMDGVRTDVQELVIELQAAMQQRSAEVPTEMGIPTELRGGISMGPSRRVSLSPPDVERSGEYGVVGTLGALVRDRSSGAAMALTNFHVACVDKDWRVGDRMVQPGIPDGGDAQASQFGSLTRAQLTDNTDGAVITLDSDQGWSASVEGIGTIDGQVQANVGTAVQKCGRTTGCTFGTVASIDATLSLDYGDGLGTRTLRRQIRIATNESLSSRFSQQGDSGSVVMDLKRYVLGLLFAGSSDGSTTFANPIGTALDDLDADLAIDSDVRSISANGS